MIAIYGGSANKIGNRFGIFFLFMFITFFAGGIDASEPYRTESCSMGPRYVEGRANHSACYVYTTELFPTWMRAQGVAFSISGLFLMTVLYTSIAPTGFAEVGWRFFLGRY
jgi:hypothetical protein